jgi:hypothetical protein
MGNDDYTTYKNGEIGDGKNDILWHCFTHIGRYKPRVYISQQI